MLYFFNGVGKALCETFLPNPPSCTSKYFPSTILRHAFAVPLEMANNLFWMLSLRYEFGQKWYQTDRVDVSNQDVKKFVLRITLGAAGAQKTA